MSVLRSIGLGLVVLVGCSSEPPPKSAPKPEPETSAEIPVGRSEDLPIPTFLTRSVEIHTPEPGFVVFINGEPARTTTGEFLLTPCEVQVPQSTSKEIEVIVAKEGFSDASRLLVSGDQSELLFEDVQGANPLIDSVLSYPLLYAEVGKPIGLLSLNTPLPELDPYVSSDGLSMWFVGDRDEGRGLYHAARKSTYEMFSPPQLHPVTLSGDLPATPSVSSDGRLAYLVPATNRVLSVPIKRETFERPQILNADARTDLEWEAAQLLPSGKQLYWTQRPKNSADRFGMRATRSNRSESFKDAEEFNLPGAFPCLSSDGKRQYFFDGKTLKRARRRYGTEPFSTPETLLELDLPNYQANTNRRSFWVSDDEQWLYYSANVGQGDLYAVRISPGPKWRYAPTGQPAAPRQMIAKTEPVNPGSLPFEPPTPPEKTEPEPDYPEFRAELVELLRTREYEKAKTALEEAKTAPLLAEDQTLLAWDAEEYNAVTGFWESIREKLTNMAPDTEIRIRTTKVKFVKFEEDVIHYRLSKAGEKPLTEMQTADLVALLDPASETENLQTGLFLYFDETGNQDRAMGYLENAGKDGGLFFDRQAGRLLHLAKKHMANFEIAEALTLLERLLKEFPESPSGEVAKTMIAGVYEKVEWETTGGRVWDKPEPGTYVAVKFREPRSYLISPSVYSHFELRTEWKITSPGGSGGVYFRFGNPLKDDPYRKAFKVHLADDKDFKPDPQSTGALHTYEAPSENASKKRGEWNTLRLRVKNLKTEIWINEKKVLDTIAQNDLVPLKGHIALDGVLGGIAYRKTLIVELSPAEQ